MMKSRASILSIYVLFAGLCALPACADPPAREADLRELLPKLDGEQLHQLIVDGELSHMIEPEEGPRLVPGADFDTAVTDDLDAVGYSIGVEVLHIMPGDYENFDVAAAANLLLELSTLEGLEYYSASRERMRTLFVQSYAIDDAEHGNRIPDPAVSSVPARGELFMFQEDMTFGKNRLKVDYAITPSTIHMITENITTFSWGPLPLIKPGNLRLHALVYKGKGFVLYYGNFGAKALSISVLEKRIYNSFYNRLAALYGWFERKLLAAEAGK